MDFGSRWDSAQNRIPNEINSRVRGQSASRFRDTRWLVNNFSITYTKSSLLSRIYKKHYIVVIKMACAWECLGYAIFNLLFDGPLIRIYSLIWEMSGNFKTSRIPIRSISSAFGSYPFYCVTDPELLKPNSSPIRSFFNWPVAQIQ